MESPVKYTAPWLREVGGEGVDERDKTALTTRFGRWYRLSMESWYYCVIFIITNWVGGGRHHR